MPRGVSRYDEAALQQRLWNPNVLLRTGMIAAWYDADDFTTLTLTNTGAVGIPGQAVEEWRDKSLNVRHAQQTITAQRPQYRFLGNGDVTIGAKPTIRFDVTDDNFVIANSLGLRTASYLHAIAIRKSNVAAAADTVSMRPIITGTGGTYQLGASNSILLSNETICPIVGPDNGSTGNIRLGATIANYARPAQQPEIMWCHTNSLTVAGQNYAVRQNGKNISLNVLVGNRNNSLAPNAASPALTGMSISNPGACVGICDFSEIILSINTDFRNVALELIEGYLSWKWDVPLDASHPFANRPPLIGD